MGEVMDPERVALLVDSQLNQLGNASVFMVVKYTAESGYMKIHEWKRG